MFGIFKKKTLLEQGTTKTLAELKSAVVGIDFLIDDESNGLNLLRTVEGAYDASVEHVTSQLVVVSRLSSIQEQALALRKIVILAMEDYVLYSVVNKEWPEEDREMIRKVLVSDKVFESEQDKDMFMLQAVLFGHATSIAVLEISKEIEEKDNALGWFKNYGDVYKMYTDRIVDLILNEDAPLLLEVTVKIKDTLRSKILAG